jgi:hypothetical protein
MFRLAQWVGLSPRTGRDRTRRRRSFQASIEAVEDRKLMSTLSAISWPSGGVRNTIGGTVEALTKLAPLSKDSDPSGMIHSTRHGLTSGGDTLAAPDYFVPNSQGPWDF